MSGRSHAPEFVVVAGGAPLKDQRQARVDSDDILAGVAAVTLDIGAFLSERDATGRDIGRDSSDDAVGIVPGTGRAGAGERPWEGDGGEEDGEDAGAEHSG